MLFTWVLPSFLIVTRHGKCQGLLWSALGKKDGKAGPECHRHQRKLALGSSSFEKALSLDHASADFLVVKLFA